MEWLASDFLCFIGCIISSNSLVFFLYDSYYFKCTLQKVWYTVKIIFACVLTALPFVLFQFYGYSRFCNDPDNIRPYCISAFPSIYAYVQSAYWNVGLFKSFQVSQIPNFFLAAPALLYSLSAIVRYVRENPFTFFSAGFVKYNSIVVYYYHYALMVSVAIMFMNIQVSTRFLSACAPLYWYLADLVLDKRSELQLNLILSWSLGFIIIGTTLFTNFIVWV